MDVFKKDLSSVLTEKIENIQKEYQRLEKEKSYILKSLEQGNEKALKISNSTLNQVKEELKFYNRNNISKLAFEKE